MPFLNVVNCLKEFTPQHGAGREKHLQTTLCTTIAFWKSVVVSVGVSAQTAADRLSDFKLFKGVDN